MAIIWGMKDSVMQNLKVIKYTKDKKKEWDTFVAKTKVSSLSVLSQNAKSL